MSDSVRPHRWQPTRLPRPWDSPGKSTGVGCYFLLQCMKGKRESEVAQSCPTLSDSMDYSPPGSSVHGIFLARVPEWVASLEISKHWRFIKLLVSDISDRIVKRTQTEERNITLTITKRKSRNPKVNFYVFKVCMFTIR